MSRRSPTAQPLEIELTDYDSVLQILWDDGHVGRHRLDVIRALSPLPEIVDISPPISIELAPKSYRGLRIVDVEVVGRQAVGFIWSDGLETGPYDFQFLRGIENTA